MDIVQFETVAPFILVKIKQCNRNQIIAMDSANVANSSQTFQV